MAAGGLAFDGSVGARKGVAALGFIFNCEPFSPVHLRENTF